jgi:hypothetical protein
MSIGSLIVRHAAILCAAFLPVAAAAADKPPQHFTPSGPWAMEYADQTCRLIRNFSDGTGVVTLAFEKNVLGPGLTLGLAGKALQVSRTVPMARFRYSGESRARASALLKTVLTDGRDSFLVTDVPLVPIDQLRRIIRNTKPPERLAALESAEMAAASKITSISFTYSFIGDPAFEIGPMVAPLKALRACVVDLVKSWGIDPQRMATMSHAAEAITAPRYWLSIDDYPDAMWREHKGGIVPFRLVIDEDGTVKDCLVIVEQRGPFEEAVCKAVGKRARFKPALDADKKPMRSYWMQVVNFLKY